MMDLRTFIKFTTVKSCLALLLSMQANVHAVDATNDLFLNVLNQSDDGLFPSLAEPNKWLEEVEGRWSLSDADQNKQQFTLRIKPKSAGQHAAETSVRSLMVKQRQLEKQISLTDEIRYRYLLVTKYVFHQNQLSIGKAKKEHLLQQVKLFHALAQSENFQPEKLLKTELDLRNVEINNQVTSQKINVLNKKLLALSGDSSSKEFFIAKDKLLPITDISSTLDAISSKSLSKNLRIESSVVDHQIAKEELYREKSLNGFGLNFMDLQYEEQNGRVSDQSFKFSIGVRIPIGENYSLSQKKLDAINAEHELIDQRYQTDKLYESLRMNISFLETEFQGVSSAITKIDDNLNNDVIKNNMFLLLGLKQEKFNLIERSAEIKNEVYELYIQYLYSTGVLCHQPLQNWLHTGLPVL